MSIPFSLQSRAWSSSNRPSLIAGITHTICPKECCTSCTWLRKLILPSDRLWGPHFQQQCNWINSVFFDPKESVEMHSIKLFNAFLSNLKRTVRQPESHKSPASAKVQRYCFSSMWPTFLLSSTSQSVFIFIYIYNSSYMQLVPSCSWWHETPIGSQLWKGKATLWTLQVLRADAVCAFQVERLFLLVRD